MEDYENLKDLQTTYKEAIKQMEDEFDFIWGMKSCDDVINSEANLHTMNDIDIIYNKNEKKYYISIETIYAFDTTEKLNIYIIYLFNNLTNWMQENGYDTNIKLELWEIFDETIINNGFYTIEGLYANFKRWVNNFIIQ